jgi:hypothetical protein
MMNNDVDYYYVVRRASGQDAIHALRALDAFVRSPAGHVRLYGPDRVVVWRDDADLYLSPGALSLAGYLEPDPDLPRSAYLLGPEMTPSRTYPGPAMTPSGRIAATDLPSSCVLVLGESAI